MSSRAKTSRQPREDLRLLLGDTQQRLGRSTGLSPPLLPILHRAHTHTHQAGEDRLRQVEPGTDRLRRYRHCQRTRAQIDLARFVSLDLLDTFQNLLSNVASDIFDLLEDYGRIIRRCRYETSNPDCMDQRRYSCGPFQM